MTADRPQPYATGTVLRTIREPRSRAELRAMATRKVGPRLLERVAESVARTLDWETGRAWPGAAYIANDTGDSRSRVSQAMHLLRHNGWWTWTGERRRLGGSYVLAWHGPKWTHTEDRSGDTCVPTLLDLSTDRSGYTGDLEVGTPVSHNHLGTPTGTVVTSRGLDSESGEGQSVSQVESARALATVAVEPVTVDVTGHPTNPLTTVLTDPSDAQARAWLVALNAGLRVTRQHVAFTPAAKAAVRTAMANGWTPEAVVQAMKDDGSWRKLTHGGGVITWLADHCAVPWVDEHPDPYDVGWCGNCAGPLDRYDRTNPDHPARCQVCHPLRLQSVGLQFATAR